MGDERKAEQIEELLRLEPALMRARFSVQPPPLLDIDITMLQFKALMSMFSAATNDPNGMRVSDLAKCLSVSAATASILVDRMVDRGFVDRREDPQDRRQHLCRTSAQGQELIVHFFEAMRAQSRELLAVLSEDELDALIESTNILIEAADRIRVAAGLPEPECVLPEAVLGLPSIEETPAARVRARA